MVNWPSTLCFCFQDKPTLWHFVSKKTQLWS